MGSRIKIRLIDTFSSSEEGVQASSEKVAFELNPGDSLEVVGHQSAFTRWKNQLEYPIAKITLDEAEGLFLEGTPQQPLIQLRGEIRPRFSLKSGDRWETPAGTIEFLDVPKPTPRLESVENETRWISRARPEPVSPEVLAPNPLDDADAVWPLDDTSIDVASYHGARYSFHFVVSLSLVFVGAETAQLIAMGFEHEISPLPTPFTALFANALAVSLAFIFESIRSRLKMRGTFLEYYRFFAWVALACIPWAGSFAFPWAFRAGGSFLLAATAASYFLFRFKPQTKPFLFVSFGTWATALLAGLLVLPRAMERLPKVELVERDLASAPEYETGSDLPPSENPDGIAPESAYTQFFQAIRAGSLETVKKLTEDQLVDAEFSLENGSTPLHVAVKAEKADIVKYLLNSRRANPNVPDHDGLTPLAWAVLQKNAEIVELLLKKKADSRIRRPDGMSIREIAQKLGDPAILDLIKKYSPEGQ